MFHVFSPRGGTVGRVWLDLSAMTDADIAAAVGDQRHRLGLEADETVVACSVETGTAISLDAAGAVQRFSPKQAANTKK